MSREVRPSVFVTSIAPQSIAASCSRILNRPWISSVLAGARSVAIKINLCDYRLADSGATTDPMVLGALIDEIRRLAPGVRIAVIENDATSVQADSLFRLLGIWETAQAHGADVVNVAGDDWIPKRLEGGRVLREVPVPRIVDDADVFIDLAKLKTNSFTRMTGCLKNMFGLARPKRKTAYHSNLADILIDLTRAMRPHLCIIDGMIAMEGIGAPAFGRPKHAGIILAGGDIVATDACAARLIGFSPRFVGHIRAAAAAGIGSLQYLLETDIPNFRYRDHHLEFDNLQFLVRTMIRGRVGLGA